MGENKLSTPLAIVLAGAFIAVAIYLSNANPLNLKSQAINTSTTPQPTQAPYTIAEKLIEYAEAAQLNQSEFVTCYEERRSAEEIGQDIADGQTAGVGGTPSFFINGELLVGAQPFSEVKRVIDQHLDGTSAATTVEVATKDEPFLGAENAPITMVEFTDYQCPFCKQAFDNNWNQLKKEYIGTGKVKYVVRDFPLGFHPNAEPAAIAANCAFEQGGNDAYFAYHDLLFANQTEWEIARQQ